MHFILISKKESFQEEQINTDLLNSPHAPSLISREAIRYQISNFIVYIYPYNQIDAETRGYSYYKDEDKLLLCNGLINIDNSLRNQDIVTLFDEINSSPLMGDYQLISLDKDGNGFIKTPPVSIRQLFYYEDENCTVLSTEIKLIVDGIKKFQEEKFITHFDPDFMEDTIFREWTARDYPENTIFREIKRIYPIDIKYFKEGKLVIERKKSVKIPEWFENAFYEDRDNLYDNYYETVHNFVETNLVHLKDKIDKIIVGVTGGVDSRLTMAILSRICKKHQIPLICYTAGQSTHPDVVIARKVAEILDVPHFHHQPHNNRSPNSKEINDYVKTFYMAQGDWNSKDFVEYYQRKISSRSSPLKDDKIPPAIGAYPVNESDLYQLGLSTYKRSNIEKTYITNRWTGRRILFNQNFYLPLFNTVYEFWFGLLYGKINNNAYKELIYEMLKRSEPELIEIPLVGDKLPQVDVEPYSHTMNSKHHEREPFLWDYDFVMKNLKPVLSRKFDGLDNNIKSILKLVGLNELDYFIDIEIQNSINSYQRKKIDLKEFFKALLKERFRSNLPKNKSLIRMPKDGMSYIPYNSKSYYLSKMQILMEFASVSNFNSFEELENIINTG